MQRKMWCGTSTVNMLEKRIGPKTERYAVLGEVLDHTWSPYLHNTLFSLAGVDAVYLPLPVKNNHLGAAVEILRDAYNGFNVTIPYKEKIIPFLDEIDSAVKKIGAVNTVENRSGRLIGHNTDGLGMITAFQKNNINVDGVKALIVGGGGAAKVAAYEILSRGGRVCFAVRNINKIENLIENLNVHYRDKVGACDIKNITEEYDLLINCTPVGMFPNIHSCPVDEKTILRMSTVFDAVYNPRETLLLSIAKRLKRRTVEGLEMLFYQAIEAERIWLRNINLSEEQINTVYNWFRDEL